MNLGLVPYSDAFALQRSLAGAVSQGAIPETVVFVEHGDAFDVECDLVGDGRVLPLIGR